MPSNDRQEKSVTEEKSTYTQQVSNRQHVAVKLSRRGSIQYVLSSLTARRLLSMSGIFPLCYGFFAVFIYTRSCYVQKGINLVKHK